VGALLVIGRGARPQGRRAEQDSRETDQDPARLAAARAATEKRGGSGMRHARLEQAVLQVSAVAPVGGDEQQR
jgi:hypothetical protein